jgi:hypothetical protein
LNEPLIVAVEMRRQVAVPYPAIEKADVIIQLTGSADDHFFTIGDFVGSVATASINRRLAKAILQPLIADPEKRPLNWRVKLADHLTVIQKEIDLYLEAIRVDWLRRLRQDLIGTGQQSILMHRTITSVLPAEVVIDDGDMVLYCGLPRTARNAVVVSSR